MEYELQVCLRKDSEAQRRIRLQFYHSRVQDYTFPFETWPWYIKEMMLLEHKKLRDRYRLMLFFLYNGCLPEAAVNLIQVKDWVRCSTVMDPVHQRAKSQYLDIIKKHGSGALYKTKIPANWDLSQ